MFWHHLTFLVYLLDLYYAYVSCQSTYFIPISGMKKSYHSMFPSTLPPNVVGILYITVAYIEILIRRYILFPFNLKAYFKDTNRKRMVHYIYLS